MNLTRYKNLLTELASLLSKIGDTKGAGFFLRWLHAADGLKDAPHPNQSLRTQLSQVQRSARAIIILAIEQYLSPIVLGLPKQNHLEFAVEQLLNEAARLAKELKTVDEVLRDPGLPGIVNEFLSSVEFVMDYVQLHFNSSMLSALAFPEVRERGSIYRAKDAGYRDALCRRIGAVVSGVELHEEQEIAVLFSDDSSIRILAP